MCVCVHDDAHTRDHFWQVYGVPGWRVGFDSNGIKAYQNQYFNLLKSNNQMQMPESSQTETGILKVSEKNVRIKNGLW